MRPRAQDEIATFPELDEKTVRKHFRQEADRGSIEATTRVAWSLFRIATNRGSVAAAIFGMKARAGWREKHDPSATASGDETDKSINVVGYFPEATEPGAPRPIIEADWNYSNSTLPRLDSRERD
jgi:hypothetical protein